MSEPTDLTTVTTDELIDELKRRHDGMVVLLERDVTAKGIARDARFYGGSSRCLGMIERARRQVWGHIREEEAEDEED